MDDAEHKRIAFAIREYIASQGMSREAFAFKAGLSIGTINKMMVGIFTEKGLSKVENNIGIRFRSHNIIKTASSDFHGAYSYDDCFRYEGFYEFIRYEFDKFDIIHSYAMQIVWSELDACLVIRHLGIADSEFKQFGQISMPKNAPFIFILSDTNGWHQLCLLSRIDYNRKMYGGLFALSEVSLQQFMPRTVAVALIGRQEKTTTRKVQLSDVDFVEFANEIEIAKHSFLHQR